MVANVILLSKKHNEIDNFLSKFYNSQIYTYNSFSWKQEFPNPIDIVEIASVFSDNYSNFDINMWISLDKDIFIKISPSNIDTIIKYIFERYPY